MSNEGVTIDSNLVQRLVEQAVEANINKLVDQICADPEWTVRVERLINQAAVHETLARLGSIDISSTIKKQVDENMTLFTNSVLKNFTSTGIVDRSTKCELTVMDDVVVVENCLTATNVEAVNSVKTQHLVVTGSINTDNESWSALVAYISQKTLDQLTEKWNKDLVNQTVKQIQDHGINFDEIRVKGQKIIDGNRLTHVIVDSNLQSVGTLKNLLVQGEAKFNNTLNVLNTRLGINTDSPEKALGIWDEEVSIVIGKHKLNQAYIGTNREQSVAIGVNREPQIEIMTDGLTRIKQLQIGLHKISHATQVPGWSGTRGDMVFNVNPGADRVFAWVCLGAHKWQTLKSAE